MNAFLDMMSKFTPEADSDSDYKLYRVHKLSIKDFPSVNTMGVCPVCGAEWDNTTAAHRMSWNVYTCGYQAAGVPRRNGRRFVYMITGVSVTHVGPIPDEGEDII